MRRIATIPDICAAGALAFGGLASGQAPAPTPVPPPPEVFAPIPRMPVARIIGGTNADAEAYPWMVSLSRIDSGDLRNAHSCGGTLVHPQWVVTAAHCLEGILPEHIDVILGVEDLATPGSYERIHVAEIIIHPDYNPLNSDADFALLRLATPASGGHAATIGIIDSPNLEAAGTSCRVTGWGATDSAGTSYPDRLQEVDLPIVDFATANASYDGTLTSNMIAAGPADGSADSCFGDSGGPLIVFDPALRRWMLTGIVSFGNGCAIPGVYGIYTRMLRFRRFTLDHISPGYSAWESSSGAVGRHRDPDGDGRDNIREFIGLSNPATPDRPHPLAPGVSEISGTGYGSIDWTLPAWRPEWDLGVEFTSDPASGWQALDIPTHTVSSTLAGDRETITLRAPVPLDTAPRRGFFRTSTALSPLYRPVVRPFTLGGRVTGTISADDAPHPTIASTLTHSYLYQPDSEAGSPVRLFARSSDFDVRFELLDASDQTIIEISTDDDAAGITGGDEEISFTPAADTDYLLRVSAETPDSPGSYTIGGFFPAVFDALPQVTIPQNTTSSLLVSDPPNPLLVPGLTYRHKDLRISPGTGTWSTISMNRITAIDPLIQVVDAENNKPTGWFDDDSGSGTNARLLVRLIAGHHYLVRCTTAFENQTGNFTLATSTATVPTLAPGASATGSLGVTDNLDPLDPDAYKDDFLVGPLVPGQSYTVDLEAGGTGTLDTFLYQLDPVTGEIRATDDDGGTGFDSRIRFTAREPDAIIRVTSIGSPNTGPYTLSVSSP